LQLSRRSIHHILHPVGPIRRQLTGPPHRVVSIGERRPRHRHPSRRRPRRPIRIRRLYRGHLSFIVVRITRLQVRLLRPPVEPHPLLRHTPRAGVAVHVRDRALPRRPTAHLEPLRRLPPPPVRRIRPIQRVRVV